MEAQAAALLPVKEEVPGQYRITTPSKPARPCWGRAQTESLRQEVKPCEGEASELTMPCWRNLVAALVLEISDESRRGASPLQGTKEGKAADNLGLTA